jgi:hypothetical protein
VAVLVLEQVMALPAAVAPAPAVMLTLETSEDE